MAQAIGSDLRKPVDLGDGVACASFGHDGSWLSIGTAHFGHGFVELSALPPFDEAQRGDPVATRRYRDLMARDDHALVRVEIGGRPLADCLTLDPSEPMRPRWRGVVEGCAVEAEASVDGRGVLRQDWRVRTAANGGAPNIRVAVHARLDRPPLAEITEVDPPGPTGAVTSVRGDGAVLHVEAPVLPARASIEVTGDAGPWRVEDAGAAELSVDATRPDGGAAFAIIATLDGGRSDPASARSNGASPTTAAPSGMGGGLDPPSRLVERALAYVRGCTALLTGPDERAILTDHRLLPLSWTRDAYYQATLLLSTDEAEDRERVADHLRWLWRRNERPDGRWLRSHHANGRRKDRAFQADQQLYPLIELADAWRVTGAMPPGVDWAEAVPAAWDAALAAVDPTLGLVGTRETAADEPAAAPYIAGAQIALWYAARRLAELAAHERIGLETTALLAFADRVRAAFDRHLVVNGRWAYATDDRGQLIDYHDANDLPVALAPAWGFCSADDPAWLATMRFAFSPANPGFWDGPMPGLGSAHTPGAWTLGDVQAWLLGTLTADADAAAAAVDRLTAVAAHDGMLPEAYLVGADGELWRIRHWFAWPGAAFGAFWTLSQRGELVARLGVSS